MLTTWELRLEAPKDRAQPPKGRELELIADYLRRVGAVKCSPVPGSNHRVVFTAPVERVAVGRTEFRCPPGMVVDSNDFRYMPSAFGGDYALWKEEMRWYLELPEGHDDLWGRAVGLGEEKR